MTLTQRQLRQLKHTYTCQFRNILKRSGNSKWISNRDKQSAMCTKYSWSKIKSTLSFWLLFVCEWVVTAAAVARSLRRLYAAWQISKHWDAHSHIHMEFMLNKNFFVGNATCGMCSLCVRSNRVAAHVALNIFDNWVVVMPSEILLHLFTPIYCYFLADVPCLQVMKDRCSTK